MKRARCLSCYEPLDGHGAQIRQAGHPGQNSPNSGDSYHPRCARALFGTPKAPSLEVATNDVERLALEVVNRRLALTGAQRKLSLSMIDGAGSGPPRLTIVGALGGTHILKPPTPEYPHLPEVEDLTMALAGIAGIELAPHGLIRMSDGALAYVTRRFDRDGGRKLAVEDLCQLSEKPTAAKYRSSAEKAGKVLRRYSSNPGSDALRFFELVVNAFVTGNADMHLKNFALLTRRDGMRGLSPAYDLVCTRALISARADPEELALPVNGRKRKLTTKDFRALAAALEITPVVVDRLFKRLAGVAPRMLAHIAKSFLPEKLRLAYTAIVTGRLKRLGLS